MAGSVQNGPNNAARILNVILGAWLFISAFAWPHTLAQRTSTWIVGALCVIFALIATSAPRFRYVNTILAIWLFISAWVLPSESAGTMWNNVIVAIAIFIVSLAPSRPTTGSSGLLERDRSAHPA